MESIVGNVSGKSTGNCPGSSELLRKEHEAIDNVVASGPAFLVFQWLADETKYRMMQRMLAGLKKMCPGEIAVLAMHGRVLWDSAGPTEVNEEELVIRPVGLAANTAASMWGAWNALLPRSLMQALKGLPPVELVALTPGSDSFSANEMLIHHVENLTSASADRVFVLPGFCHQHKTGNAMGPLVARTGILRPSFCLAKRMRADKFARRFRQGRKAALALCLKHIKGSECPAWRPNPDDQRHAAVVLDLFYFKKELRDGDAGVSLRRTRGLQLLKRFAGDWKSKHIVLWDPDDEFATKLEAIDEADKILEEAGFHVAGAPAENKWLSMWPVSQSVGTMMCFHYVFLFALRYACQVQGTEVEEATAIPDDSVLVGAPTKEAWHKMERSRELRALAWAERERSKFATSLYAFLGEKCMRHHFKLFKHAQQSPYGNERSLIFDLCSPSSFIQKSIDELLGLLHSSDAWGPLISIFGPFDDWPPEWKLMAADCTRALAGNNL